MSSSNEQLPEERTHPSRPRRVVFIVFATMISVVALNFLLGELLRRYTTNLGYYLIAKKWDLLEVQEEPVDWLIVGDSSCNQGVRPDVIVRERGETALNLCTTAQQLVIEGTWQLERYLQRVGPPRKGVIVVHVYDIWPTDASGQGGMGYRPPIHQGLSLVPLYWGFWRDYHPPLELTTEQEQELGILRYVPAYGQSETVRRWLFSPRWSRRVLQRRQFDDQGYMRADEGREKSTAHDTSSHLKYLQRRKGFDISPLNQTGFKTMVDLTAEHGLSLYLALSPLHEGLAKNRRFGAHLRQARKGLKGLCGLGAHVHCLLLDDPASFPAEGMENSDHVTHPLAETYTLRLLEAMKETE